MPYNATRPDEIKYAHLFPGDLHNLYLIFFGLDLPSHMPFSMRLQGNRRRILTSSGTRGGLEGGDVARVDGKTPGDDAVDLDDGVVDIREGS